MSAYQNSYAVAVIHKNKSLREFQGAGGIRTVKLPFDSEYQLRLINKTLSDACAQIEIDGVDISPIGQKIVIRAGQTVDIERFITEGDVGKRFKFVSKDAVEKDGGDPNNARLGVVSVKFYAQTDVMKAHNHHPLSYNKISTIFAYNAAEPSSVMLSNDCHSIQCNTAAGGTVEGSESTQRFTEVMGYFNSWAAASIDIRIVGETTHKEEAPQKEFIESYVHQSPKEKKVFDPYIDECLDDCKMTERKLSLVEMCEKIRVRSKELEAHMRSVYDQLHGTGSYDEEKEYKYVSPMDKLRDADISLSLAENILTHLEKSLFHSE